MTTPVDKQAKWKPHYESMLQIAQANRERAEKAEAALAEAPHEYNCPVRTLHELGSPCNCWKSRALRAERGE